jgi:hypothetical protein
LKKISQQYNDPGNKVPNKGSKSAKLSWKTSYCSSGRDSPCRHIGTGLARAGQGDYTPGEVITGQDPLDVRSLSSIWTILQTEDQLISLSLFSSVRWFKAHAPPHQHLAHGLLVFNNGMGMILWKAEKVI